MISETISVVETDFAADGVSHVSAASSSSLVKHMKNEKFMQWWFFGPVVLAVMMFLIMGTVFEHRIEALWRRILERRQALSSQETEITETEQTATGNSLHAIKTATPSQKSIASCKSDTAMTTRFTKIIEGIDTPGLTDVPSATANERFETAEVNQIRRVIEIIGPTVMAPSANEFTNFTNIEKSTVP